MSTRSVTVIQMNYTDSKLSLYRHSDGYLAVAGAALVEALNGATCPEQVAGRLLCMTYDREQEPRLRAVYHVTTSAADHGDAEYVYTAWLSPEGWRVRCSVRPAWDETAGDDFTTWPASVYTLADFAASVNDDRRRANMRLAGIRKAQPYLAGAPDFEMVAAGDAPLSVREA